MQHHIYILYRVSSTKHEERGSNLYLQQRIQGRDRCGCLLQSRVDTRRNIGIHFVEGCFPIPDDLVFCVLSRNKPLGNRSQERQLYIYIGAGASVRTLVEGKSYRHDENGDVFEHVCFV